MERAEPGLEEQTRMAVVLELGERGQEELRVVCEGQCDVDKVSFTVLRPFYLVSS